MRIELQGDERGIGRRSASFDIQTFGGDDQLIVDLGITSSTESLQLTANLGDGNDVAGVRMEQLHNKYPENMNHEIHLDGGGGMDTLSADLNLGDDTPETFNTHVEMHNAAEKQLQVTGGGADLFVTANSEPAASDPDCLIWDVIGSGVYNVPEMMLYIGGADEVDVEVGDARLSSLSIEVDTRSEDLVDGFNFLIEIDAVSFIPGSITLTVRPTVASLDLENITLSGAMEVDVREHSSFSRNISGMHITNGGSYDEVIRTSKAILIIAEDIEGEALIVDDGGSFGSEVIGGSERNLIVNRVENVVINRGGVFRQFIDAGGGADTVFQSLGHFENYGTAVLNTRLGAGNDSYRALAHDIYVAPGANLAMQVDGNRGRDLIRADVQATVDGNYSFVARGGRHADVIRVSHEFSTTRAGEQPNVNILIEGNGGNDWIELSLVALEFDDDWLHALVDGGKGNDTACTLGEVRVVNVERHC